MCLTIQFFIRELTVLVGKLWCTELFKDDIFLVLSSDLVKVVHTRVRIVVTIAINIKLLDLFLLLLTHVQFLSLVKELFILKIVLVSALWWILLELLLAGCRCWSFLGISGLLLDFLLRRIDSVDSILVIANLVSARWNRLLYILLLLILLLLSSSLVFKFLLILFSSFNQVVNSLKQEWQSLLLLTKLLLDSIKVEHQLVELLVINLFIHVLTTVKHQEFLLEIFFSTRLIASFLIVVKEITKLGSLLSFFDLDNDSHYNILKFIF